jgi:LysM repeat protein
MNYLRGVVSFIMLAVFFSSGILAAEDIVHVVGKGETVYAISRSYRVSPEELMRYNNITDASRLQIGKRLLIPPSAFSDLSPTTTSSAAAAQPFIEYRVVKNDTLYGIARTQGVTLQSLLDINGFSSNHVIKIGDMIKIPVPAAGTGTVQTAQSGVRPTSRAVDTLVQWPVNPKEISYMTGKLYGVVVQGERFEPVKSLTQGKVISAGPYRGFGKVAIVEAAGGYLYVYGGCESLSVKEGDRIGPGTELGKLGIDAVSEKPQLFFMVYRSNTPIDPAKAPRALAAM